MADNISKLSVLNPAERAFYETLLGAMNMQIDAMQEAFGAGRGGSMFVSAAMETVAYFFQTSIKEGQDPKAAFMIAVESGWDIAALRANAQQQAGEARH